jgi:hypothetical protein
MDPETPITPGPIALGLAILTALYLIVLEAHSLVLQRRFANTLRRTD